MEFLIAHPRLGRWIQRDPLGYADGMNLYAYGKSSPVDTLDPSGNFIVSLSIFIGTAVGMYIGGKAAYKYTMQDMEKNPDLYDDYGSYYWRFARNMFVGTFAGGIGGTLGGAAYQALAGVKLVAGAGLLTKSVYIGLGGGAAVVTEEAIRTTAMTYIFEEVEPYTLGQAVEDFALGFGVGAVTTMAAPALKWGIKKGIWSMMGGRVTNRPRYTLYKHLRAEGYTVAEAFAEARKLSSPGIWKLQRYGDIGGGLNLVMPKNPKQRVLDAVVSAIEFHRMKKRSWYTMFHFHAAKPGVRLQGPRSKMLKNLHLPWEGLHVWYRTFPVKAPLLTVGMPIVAYGGFRVFDMGVEWFLGEEIN